MRALALDFDGVICNSGHEVKETALAAWSRLFPSSDLARRLRAEAEPGQHFDRLLPLGNRAEDFGVALHIIDRRLPTHNQADYDHVRASLGQPWLDAYHHAFYRARKRRRSTDPDSWFHLHTTYSDFVGVLHRHTGEIPFAIVTAKDGDSVSMLLRRFGCAELFPADLIFDKETGIDKTSHLTLLSEALGIPFNQITFVDDKVNHLRATAHLGIRPVLAGWGYNTPREHDEARASGFAVAALDTAEDILFNH